MLKSFFAAAGVLAATVATSHADVVYKGQIMWTAVNASCAGGPNVGDDDKALFHPKGVTGNANFSSLNQFHRFGGDGATLAGGHFNSTLQDVDERGIGSDPYDPSTWEPTAGVKKVSVTSPDVSNLNPPPAAIRLEGQIQNPWSDPSFNDCVVTYIFNGVKN